MALAAVALAACAQTRTVAEVGIGTAAYQPKPAKPYAVLYKPYAEMATVACTDPAYLDANACPDAAKLSAGGTDDTRTYAAMLGDLRTPAGPVISATSGPTAASRARGAASRAWNITCGGAAVAARR